MKPQAIQEIRVESVLWICWGSLPSDEHITWLRGWHPRFAKESSLPKDHAIHFHLSESECTLPKTNIEPDNGPLEECFPLPTSGFEGPCGSSSRVYLMLSVDLDPSGDLRADRCRHRCSVQAAGLRVVMT